MTDAFLEDQNRCLADVNLNLARLTRCNSFDNETLFNSYLAYLLTIENQADKKKFEAKNENETKSTNESGFDEDEDDEDEWTDIDDDEWKIDNELLGIADNVNSRINRPSDRDSSAVIVCTETDYIPTVEYISTAPLPPTVHLKTNHVSSSC